MRLLLMRSWAPLVILVGLALNLTPVGLAVAGHMATEPTGPVTSTGPLPDLAIQRIAIELPTGGACDYTQTNLVFHVTVVNDGDAAAGSFAVQVSSANTTTQTQTVPGLAAGASSMLTFKADFGQDAVTVVVDPFNQVAESDKSNNTVTEFVPIPTLPPTCTATPTDPATMTPTPTASATASPTVTSTGTPTFVSLPLVSAVVAVPIILDWSSQPPGGGW